MQFPADATDRSNSNRSMLRAAVQPEVRASRPGRHGSADANLRGSALPPADPVPTKSASLHQLVQRRKAIVDGVMQVTRQALPFFQYRQGLRLSNQFRVAHGDCGLVGHTQRQVGMVVREVILLLVRHTYGPNKTASYRQWYPHP